MREPSSTSSNTKAARNPRQMNIVLRNSEANHTSYSTLRYGTDEAAALNESKSLNREPFAEIAKEFDSFIGMDHVKDIVYEIFALLQISQYRMDIGLNSPTQVYHMLFKGNPGTGKTTVARILAKLFLSMGVLSKGHLVEVERADLVGEYIGHTALKTRELVKKALGGILFIDEAYSLARGGEKDFGREAIDCLVKSMEDYRNQFILILAGYPEEMDDFLSMNPGLPSRFPLQIDFNDYTVQQLMQIADLMAKESQYVFAPQAEMKLRHHLAEEKLNCGYSFSNARYVRNLIEKAIRHQAVRLLQQYSTNPSRQELMLLKTEDLRWERKN
ncbi:AAA family ATPase [Paenibacillus psychroresistens]|uniref:AAA family ATPase n=1 Tax=Paenibacillus psychroresistens TaxID=1778678 RepID=A0A6B8RJU1_9BACL|nr:AAA family ATPase [Paenibacillus psychroresistens]QGQ96711.1 AAA family ATPase [Paenibacillus psychroresistens]